MILKKYKEFINEHIINKSVYEGNISLTKDDVSNGYIKRSCYSYEVDGNYSCSYINLTSLFGCPYIINGHFSCEGNYLKSLEHGPRVVTGLFKYGNNINDLRIEAEFIKSGSYSGSENENYYNELLTYMLKTGEILEDIKTWPEGFLNDNIKKSGKSIGKFKL